MGLRELLETRKSLQLLSRLAEAQERVALSLERIAAVLEGRSTSHGSGLMSFRAGSGPDDTSALMQTDADFALLETLEKKYPHAPSDADLEGDPTWET